MSDWLKKQIEEAGERLKSISPERINIIRGKYGMEPLPIPPSSPTQKPEQQ